MTMVSFEDWKKFDIRIGEILTAVRVPDTDKLLQLTVNVGEESPRQIISGIAAYAEPETLVGKKFPFIVNLEPRVIRGLESQGMILAVSSPEGDFSFLEPTADIGAGSIIK